MRKNLCLILAVLMLLTAFCACSADRVADVTVDRVFLVETADVLTDDLIDLAESERVLEMVMGGNDGVLELCAACADGLEQETKKITVLSVPSDGSAVAELLGGDTNLTKKEKAIMRSRYHASNSLCSMFNAKMGISWVAAASLLTVTKTFRCDDTEESEYLVVLKKAGDHSVAVSAYPAGDGVITVSAVPISTSLVADLIRQAGNFGFETVE